MAYSTERTPYPQMHQQTMGATLSSLWKSAQKLHESGFPGFQSKKTPKLFNFRSTF
ncbi:hypothetical protein C4K03_5810 [Pseudomonas synxantha]|uniref:Uncharacterized protein n=1 Tax=Pseudomonas synxantha TaxID=47883 RepID=A0A3G7UET1_9PSED|nr:hypothetical protein C4K03_5810 [Pseudomonas synxantha]